MNFTQLYQRISPALKKIAHNYSRQSVLLGQDDLFQEMSLYLWVKFSQGVPAGINDFYIIKGCKFHISNYLRKHKDNVVMFSLEQSSSENQTTLEETLPNQDENLHRCLDRKITFDEIRNNGFSQREKQVLSCLADGLTVREAGEKLGISHVMVVKYKKKLVKRWQVKHPDIG